MIKECKVISYNKFLNILVFDYCGKQIQTTAILNENCKTVFIQLNNGKYVIVDKDNYNKYTKEDEKKNMSIKVRKKEMALENVLE